MKSSNEIRKLLASEQAKVEAILNIAKEENRDLNAEEASTVDAIVGTDEVPGVIAQLNKDLERAHRIEKAVANKVREIEAAEEKPAKIPARAKAHGKLIAFKEEADAYASGQFVLATMFGNKKAKSWCRDNGIIKNTMTTLDNPSAAFLVPDVFENAIIELREQYGVFRTESTVVPMSGGKTVVPRLTGEVTSYYVGEGSTITASDMTVSTVELDAKKLACMTTVSSELNEDAVVSVADMLARSIAQDFAISEDEAGFLGDGSSTYGGISGLASALQAGSLYTAGATRDLFADLNFADFESMIGQCKLWRGSSPKWYISQAGWAASMQRLANAAGGVTMAELANGMAPAFMGFPVVISQVLTSALTSTTGLRACYFGDLRMGSYFGSKRGITIALDSSRYFEQDLIAIKATQRYDINIFDRGTASVSGGIIGMVFGST
jgi:HK97 family phage major capsid protein